MKAKFVKSSVCECGFPILDESIPLGIVYDVDPNKTDYFTVICGGCGKHNIVVGIWVEGRGAGKAGWMPREIFEYESKS